MDFFVSIGQWLGASVASDKHWLEVTYWTSQIAIPFVAVIGVWLAVRQLRAIKLQAKATFLLELDRRFEDTQMQEARTLLGEYLTETKQKVGQENNIANDKERMNRVRVEFGTVLDRIRADDQAKYLKIMRFVNFFETVGVMVDAGYVSVADIDSLLRGPISQVDLCFRRHIEERQKETGMPDGLYRHALDLSRGILRRIDDEG